MPPPGGSLVIRVAVPFQSFSYMYSISCTHSILFTVNHIRCTHTYISLISLTTCTATSDLWSKKLSSHPFTAHIPTLHLQISTHRLFSSQAKIFAPWRLLLPSTTSSRWTVRPQPCRAVYLSFWCKNCAYLSRPSQKRSGNTLSLPSEARWSWLSIRPRNVASLLNWRNSKISTSPSTALDQILSSFSDFPAINSGRSWAAMRQFKVFANSKKCPTRFWERSRLMGKNKRQRKWQHNRRKMEKPCTGGWKVKNLGCLGSNESSGTSRSFS